MSGANTKAMSPLDCALEYVRLGVPVFPIPEGTKAGTKGGGPGKSLPTGWPELATTDTKQICAWWTATPNANVGCHMKGFVGVDLDIKLDKAGEIVNGIDAFAGIEKSHGGLPVTFRAITPSGGRHILLRLPEGHPEVANGVSSIAPGVDIRGEGGFLVGVGSRLPTGTYTEDDSAGADGIATAPPWLLSMLAKAEKRQHDGAPVADGTPLDIEHAREWLEGHPPAIAGMGGNQHTVETVFGLRDLGASQRQALELMHEWNATCEPPWADDELDTITANGFKYAKTEAGRYAPSKIAAMFDVVEQAAAVIEKAKVKGPQIVLMADLCAEDIVSAPWMVKSFLQPKTFVCVFGEPGAGKSVLCGDLAHAVAFGRPWMGQFDTQQGAALYIAIEGHGSMRRRFLALRQQYGDAPLALATGQFNLTRQEGRKALDRLVDAAVSKVGPLSLIVVDTWARLLSMAGADENHATQVGSIVDPLEVLAERTGATIAIVHHSGKQKAAGARGSNALLAAVQTEIEVVDKTTIYSRKQRDSDAHPPVGFRLESMLIGTDKAGESVYAPVVQPGPVVREERSQVTGKADLAFKKLCRLKLDDSPINTPVEDSVWKKACAEFLNPKRRSDWGEIKEKLIEAGLVEETEAGLWARVLR